MITFIYFIFIFLTLVPAFAILFVRNILFAVLLLLCSLLGTAGLFILMQAEFVGVSQILIYAGGISVLLIFGIMLSDKKGFSFKEISYYQTFSGIAIAIAIGVLLFYGSRSVKQLPTQVNAINDQEKLGFALLTDFALPFEIVGILLLCIFVGVAYIAGKPDK